MELIKALDSYCKPSTKSGEFMLGKQFGDLKYDPQHKNAVKFLVRFDELVKKLRRTAMVDDATAKATLLFAIEDAFPTVYFWEISAAGSRMSHGHI